jgi:predicted nucleic acid-binding Zn ribbon protein
MTPARRSPRSLELALGALREGLAPDSLLADVQSVWSGAVGSSIAEHAQPVSERGGVVTVSCSASVWAHELDLLGPTLLERLNQELGDPRITRLRCVATPPPDA